MIPTVKMPQGFLANGINCGVRKYRPDLGLVLSSNDCLCCGVYTKNSLKAVPVQYNMKLLPSKKIRALIVNSGHANVATGKEGHQDNDSLILELAREADLAPEQITIASTGLVGERIPVNTILPAIRPALRGTSGQINNFALAIMTTDLIPKFCSEEIHFGSQSITITACSKGSGMIHPNMGTMLGFVFTDAVLDFDFLQCSLKRSVEESYNMISVDGETSTNDMVLAYANGASNVLIDTPEKQEKFYEAFNRINRKLAVAIAKDGEGASKLITVHVKGAPSLGCARSVARAITTSPLVKTAIHGEDPNWGRILVRIGYTGLDSDCLEKLELRMQDEILYSDGSPEDNPRLRLGSKLKSDEIKIDVDLKSGVEQATAWGCDLSKRYVDINTEYS